MQMGIYFDQTLCTGCYACIVACKDWNDVSAGPASWIRIQTTEKGKYPNIFVANMINTCFHCAEPLCILACPVEAISKRFDNGVVSVDRDVCLGKDQCSQCLEVCPYRSPQFDIESNAKMQKCDLCLDRLLHSQNPICMDSCPMRALDIRPLEDLKRDYGTTREAEGFVYSVDAKPSILCRPKRDQKKLVVDKTILAPINHQL